MFLDFALCRSLNCSARRMGIGLACARDRSRTRLRNARNHSGRNRLSTGYFRSDVIRFLFEPVVRRSDSERTLHDAESKRNATAGHRPRGARGRGASGRHTVPASVGGCRRRRRTARRFFANCAQFLHEDFAGLPSFLSVRARGTSFPYFSETKKRLMDREERSELFFHPFRLPPFLCSPDRPVRVRTISWSG